MGRIKGKMSRWRVWRRKSNSNNSKNLETLIRLATAHAKVRLSKKVEKIDCNAVLNLFIHAYNNEIEKEDKKDDDDMDIDDEEKKKEEK